MQSTPRNQSAITTPTYEDHQNEDKMSMMTELNTGHTQQTDESTHSEYIQTILGTEYSCLLVFDLLLSFLITGSPQLEDSRRDERIVEIDPSQSSVVCGEKSKNIPVALLSEDNMPANTSERESFRESTPELKSAPQPLVSSTPFKEKACSLNIY